MMQKPTLLMVVAALFLLLGGVAKGVELPWWLDRIDATKPAIGEMGSVRLVGVWSDGCAPDAISSEYVAGDLHLMVAHPGINVGCPEVETPWSLTHEFLAENAGYSIFGNLFAYDPEDPTRVDRRSGPDLLVGNRRRAVFQGIGSIGEPYASSAFDVSADGRVVVGENRIQPGSAAFITSEAFAWTSRDGMRSLGILPNGIPGGSTAHGVSANGLVAVGHSSAPLFGRSFRWDAINELTALPGLTAVSESAAFATSDDGEFIVGLDLALTPGAFGTDSRRAYRWSETTGTVGLGTVHDRGGSAASDVSSDGHIVVGSAYEPQYEESGEMRRLANVAEPFVWTSESGMVGLGHMPYFIEIDVAFDYFRDSRANAVSADGKTVVGFSSIIPDSFDLSGQIRTKAFRWTEEEGLVDLGHVRGAGLVETKAVDVSEDGSVIVGMNHYELPQNVDAPEGWSPWAPFVWDEKNGMQLLSDVIVALRLAASGDLEGWNLDIISAISDDGRTIVGTGMNPSGEREGWRLVMDHDHSAGDANLDGIFNSTDLVQIFRAGEYEDGVDDNSSWASGDWNGDRDFNSTDLVLSFQTGTYDQETPAAAVPEPSNIFSIGMLWLVFGFLPLRSRRLRVN